MNTVTNLPLKDQIAAILRREISGGEMKDGEELTQERVSAALAVSRIPVREAFLQLETEGLLRRLPNRHVQVVGLTPERRRQNLAALSALECGLARLLAEKWPVEAPLRQYAQCLTSQGDALRQADTAFHLSLSRALDNPTLAQIHATGRRSLFESSACPREDSVILAGNASIALALEQRDAEGLYRSIQNYYEVFWE